MVKRLGFGQLVVGGLAAGMLAACGGTQSSTSSSPAASTAAPTASTPAPTASPTPAVLAQTVGSQGTLLVAGSNGMTLYNFSKDAPGVSNCTGACVTNWPPLTVPAGTQPTGGSGITGALATITRSDGTLQVTYKGLPLYFFHSDAKPGDTNGNYTNWTLVKP